MRIRYRRIIWLSVLAFLSFCTPIVCADETASLPKTHLIAGVPYHKQITVFSCGPAALEILYDFWSEDIDQKAISDVTRSSSMGTYTWDMVRAGCFSRLSAARGRCFPKSAPKAGYSERPLGYVSFSYASDSLWWTDLKRLIAQNIPVVLLMKYARDDDTGHYRIIVGYDEEKGVVYFVDPWGRDLTRATNLDGIITWSMTDFENAWNYTGYGTDHPFWGAVMMPWTVTIHTTGETTAGSVLEVTAEITYPCPQPFDCHAYSAFNVRAEITLPPKMLLLEGVPGIDIGYLQAGESSVVTWRVKLDGDGSGSSIAVKATGLVSGTVPKVSKNGRINIIPGKGGDKNNKKNFYPAYDYTDEIGVEKSIEL
ncbi:MAG: hypothetical protein B6D34_12055 [Candidatus Brocadia sp. UTAMX1]|nr:MAG: hypothetical protein B6D34_12055 [Candidatus Brocadia sp. UTAMX1]